MLVCVYSYLLSTYHPSYFYGDYQVIHNIADFTECCRICKDDPECQNFSFGKEGTQYSNQCHKKKGGNLGSRSEFMSSALNILSCSCFPQGGFIIFLKECCIVIYLISCNL